MGLQHALHAGHRRGGGRAAGQADQQPRQPVARAAQRRILDRVARLGALAPDPGQAVQVLDVLAAQHVQQRLRRHHAERAADAVHHRERVDAAMQGERSGALLVGIGAHAREFGAHDLAHARGFRKLGDLGDGDCALEQRIGRVHLEVDELRPRLLRGSRQLISHANRSIHAPEPSPFERRVPPVPASLWTGLLATRSAARKGRIA